jgi:hypothetical protein
VHAEVSVVGDGQAANRTGSTLDDARFRVQFEISRAERRISTSARRARQPASSDADGDILVRCDLVAVERRASEPPRMKPSRSPHDDGFES